MSNLRNPNTIVLLSSHYVPRILGSKMNAEFQCELRKNQINNWFLEKKISSCKLDEQFNPHHHIILETMTDIFSFGKKIRRIYKIF